MLLRSSSNPVLESPLLEHTKAECPTGDSLLPKSLSLTSRACSSSPIVTRCLSQLDPQSQLATSAGCSPFTRLRRVRSENDLCIVAAGLSESPALVAANSFVQYDKTNGSDFEVRSCHLHCQKDRTSLTLNRWRSLGSFPADLQSVLLSSGSAILEEVESASAFSSATSEEGEEKGERNCVSDKRALPVASVLSIAVEEGTDDVGMDVNDVGNEKDVTQVRHIDINGLEFELSMAKDARSLRNTSPKMEMQGLGSRHGGLETNSLQPSSDASSSKWQEPVYMMGYSASHLPDGKKGATHTTLLDPQVRIEPSQTMYAYHREAWEVANHGGDGDGGRGVRPPTIAGGGGGQGWSGGYGGRNSDPTELHYQAVLKENPSHALILQNYAQYLAEVKHDYSKAEQFFQRAILANPSDGELLSHYAKMLWEGQHDRERAASYFERAVQATPDNSYVVASYASFLWNAEEEVEEQGSPEEVKGSSPADVPAGGLISLVSTSLV